MKRGLMLTMAVLAAGALAPADEVDELVRKLQPPARFEDHPPDWSVKKEQVTFEFMDGPKTWDFWFIRDGEGVVAIMPTTGFHGGTVYVQNFRPGQAPKEVPFPTERWHIDTAVGAEIRTNNFIPSKYGETDESYDWKVGEKTLTLTRRYKGETAFKRWAHNTRGKKVKVDARNTIVFKVDPQRGYVVEATYDIWTDKPPKRYEYSSAAIGGRYQLWPGQATCYRHAVTRKGDGGIVGYACNHGVTKQHARESCREGGFVSFLNDKTGWSPTLALVDGGDARLVVCGAHTDLDFVLSWPENPKTRDDGLKHNGRVVLRLAALPPKVTKHVWENQEILHKGEHRLMIRLGQLEDFEDQPLELTTRQRGMPWNKNAEVGEKYAHSGNKSIVFTGRSGHGDPQIALEPSTKYRVEAWMKLVPYTEEQKKAVEQARREKIDRARAEKAKKRGKKPRPVPEFVPLERGTGWISGWTYQWTPHSNKPVERYKSNVVQAPPMGREPSEWTKVSFEFTTPKWGPFIQIDFHAKDCTAYLDDFKFAPVED